MRVIDEYLVVPLVRATNQYLVVPSVYFARPGEAQQRLGVLEAQEVLVTDGVDEAGMLRGRAATRMNKPMRSLLFRHGVTSADPVNEGNTVGSTGKQPTSSSSSRR